MGTCLKETRYRVYAVVAIVSVMLPACALRAQTAEAASGPPPSTGGVFPLSEVHRGLQATAWTVFAGARPEPMQVEILGVLKGARGPGHDMILAQLHGSKPEYTGVVAGMSGSPVYVGDKLLGSLSYRIGVFSKDPIAGITPIEQMLEVRDLPVKRGPQLQEASDSNHTDDRRSGPQNSGMEFQAMETPLVMSGFHPEAVKLWQEKMTGTGLDLVAAGGGASAAPVGQTSASGVSKESAKESTASAISSVVPGSAVSALLVRGDLEIAATCTVTYVDPKQLLACGHPILQAGPVSLPMTTTEVVATLASPLNAFKIINTGQPIGAFTEDRDSAIRGVFGAEPHMIPVHIGVDGTGKPRKLNIEVLDLPALTPQAVLVSMYESLLQTNESTMDMTYHVTGAIDVDGYAPAPLDLWATGNESGLPPQLTAALLTGEQFQKLYSSASRQGTIHAINLNVQAIPRRMSVDLASARFVSGNIVHPGDTVTVEATLRPWQQPERNVRISFRIPTRLQGGNMRVLVSDAGTLDRTMLQPRLMPGPTDFAAELAATRQQHRQDRVYVSLLVPETQAGMQGVTLSSLPVSMANALEPMRSSHGLTLNGESAEVAAEAEASGVLTGFQILNLRIEPGGGVD